MQRPTITYPSGRSYSYSTLDNLESNIDPNTRQEIEDVHSNPKLQEAIDNWLFRQTGFSGPLLRKEENDDLLKKKEAENVYDRELAETYYRLMILNPENYEFLRAYAIILDEIKDPNALKYFNAFLRKNPSDLRALMRRVKIYIDSKNYERALNDLNTIIDLNPSEEYIGFRGLVLRHLGQYEEALKNYNRALDLNPDYVNALLQRGELLLFLSQRSEALKDFNRVLELDPTNDRAIAGKAKI